MNALQQYKLVLRYDGRRLAAKSVIAALAAFVLPLSSCANDTPGNGPEVDSAYEYSAGNRDGIGKRYMGREISHVMGHRGAGWLERPDRESEERTDLLLSNLPIKPGDSVADIGAGTGYFSLPMAELVGDAGTVYAVDIQAEMLAIIEERSATNGISNIERVLATADDPRLPADTLSMVLFVDAYHEFEWPREVMTAVRDGLVSGGKVVLIEYRAEDPSVPIKRLHKMTEKQARKELEAIGLVFVSNEEFLPQQHFLVFEKP
ncbi:class I SAM-dependent methyltransferase [Gammaproteobacteria bacterium]|nr:class I SAM-dependent methyltransferase [Gammaproteobacteria bacterium]